MNDAIKHCEQGFRAWQEWRLEDALHHFNRAIEVSPSTAAGYTGRGYVRHLEGLYDEAIKDFSHAIQIDPADSEAWKGRADAFQLCSRFEEAIEDYREAIRLNSGVAEYFHRRADAYSAVGNQQLAASDYKSAVSIEPDNPVFQYLLADSLAMCEAYAEAVLHYRQAIRLDPDHLDSFVYYSLAWLLATCPDEAIIDPLEAIEHARTACAIDGWSEEQSLCAFAASHAAKGDFAEAERRQQEAIGLSTAERKEIQRQRLKLYQSGQRVISGNLRDI